MSPSTLRKRLFPSSHDREQQHQFAELEECRAKLDAINRCQAVIEFDLDGTIITANENFLKAMGYGLNEIIGQHHRMFVPVEMRESAEYRSFWQILNAGHFHSGQFQRIRKDQSEIWIQGMYCPLLDTNGQPTKVVKVAVDVTGQVQLRRQTEEVGEGVSVSIEQMVSTIAEISSHVSETAGLTSMSKLEVESTAETVQQLHGSSQSIEKVVDLIRDLADQTNLLALNATIESARAGESGKGFAVVANEVKELAKETATATEDIRAKIEAIQSETEGAVNAITQITAQVNQIHDFQNSIAAAIEEQSVTTSEIGRTVEQAAKGSFEIAQNINDVATAADDTTKGAHDTLEAASKLAHLAAHLQTLVSAFTVCSLSYDDEVEPVQQTTRLPKPVDRRPARAA